MRIRRREGSPERRTATVDGRRRSGVWARGDATPRTGEERAVRRALPRLGPRWPTVRARVSAALVDLAGGDAGFLPAVAAWDRVDAAVSAAHAARPGPVGPRDLVFVSVDPVDAALVVDALAPVVLAPLLHRAPGGTDVLLAGLRAALADDLGSDGDVLREWGADGPMFVAPPGAALAAHRRIAARVLTAWPV